MNIKSTAHARAVSDLVERITIAGVLALATDTFWCIRDTLGLSHSWLYLVMTLLAVATLITAHALYKYHMVQYRGHVAELLHSKLNALKAKHKRGK